MNAHFGYSTPGDFGTGPLPVPPKTLDARNRLRNDAATNSPVMCKLPDFIERDGLMADCPSDPSMKVLELAYWLNFTDTGELSLSLWEKMLAHMGGECPPCRQELVRRCQAALQKHAPAGSSIAPEDVSHTLLLKLWRSEWKPAGERPLGPFIHLVLGQVVRQELSRRNREQPLVGPPGEDDPAPSLDDFPDLQDPETPAELAASALDRQTILREVERMQFPCRLIISHYFGVGCAQQPERKMPVKDLAATLGISIREFYRLLRHCLNHLRRDL